MQSLKFIGTGSAFNITHGNTSAYFIRDDVLVLIDCGCTVFEKIVRLGLLDDIKDVVVLITHLHGDHVGSLSDLIFYLHYVKKINPRVIFPDKKSMKSILKVQMVPDEIYTFVPQQMLHSFRLMDLDLLILSQVVDHIPVRYKESFGYTVYDLTDDSAFFYSGDCSATPGAVQYLQKIGRYTNVYHDTCGLDYEGNVHTPLRKLAENFIYRREDVVCMHMDQKFDPTHAKDLGFSVAKSQTTIGVKFEKAMEKIYTMKANRAVMSINKVQSCGVKG